jgi:hypothetical protein
MSNLPLGFRTSRAIGESNARRAVRGGRSRVYVLSIPVIQLGLRHQFKPPRPGLHPFEAFISDPKERLRLAARSLVPRLRSPSLCRVPPRAPQRGASPDHQRAGCPRVALPRVNPTTPLANLPMANPPQHIGTAPVAQAPCTDPL